MYAVIETGGKQYRVEVGTELEVELLDVEPGQSITLERVLLVADGSEAAIGTPVVADAAVEAEVLGRERGDKVIAFKYRPKARRRVKKGHRQELTLLRIADIRYNGRSAAAGVAKATDAKQTERQRLEAAAARQAAEDAALAAKLAVGTQPAPATKRTRTRAAAPAEPVADAEAVEPEVAEPAAPEVAALEPAAPEATETAEPTATKPTKPARAAAPETPAPKRTRAKASDAGAKEPGSPEAAPKRSRTKKDE